MSAPLTRLGVPKLWHEDRARLWRFARRTVVPVTLRLAPSAAYGVDRIPRDRGGYAEAGELVREEMVRLWRLAAEAAAAGLPPALPDGTPRTRPVSD